MKYVDGSEMGCEGKRGTKPDHTCSPGNGNDEVLSLSCRQAWAEQTWGDHRGLVWMYYNQVVDVGESKWRHQAGNCANSQELRGEVLAADINLGTWMVFRAEIGSACERGSIDGEGVPAPQHRETGGGDGRLGEKRYWGSPQKKGRRRH